MTESNMFCEKEKQLMLSKNKTKDSRNKLYSCSIHLNLYAFIFI